MSGTASDSLAVQTLTPQLDYFVLAGLLRRKVAGEPFPESHRFFIHEADAYSAGPADLVQNRAYAPGTDRGGGKGGHWYFCCPAKYRNTAAGQPTAQRNRTVDGGGGERYWHSESKKKDIRGRDGKPVGAYKHTLSYVSKMKNSHRKTRLGWCMVEIELQQQQQQGDGAEQLVLCKVYRSPQADPGTSSAGAGAAPPPIDQMPLRSVRAAGCRSGMYEAGDGQRGRANAANMPSISLAASEAELGKGWVLWCRSDVAAAAAADTVMKFGGSSIGSAERMMEAAKIVLSFPAERPPPVVVLSAMGKTTTNLHLAAEKAMRWSTQNTWEIHELEAIKDLHLRTVGQLGIDSSIVSGSLDELSQLLKRIILNDKLTPGTRDLIVSYGELMSTTIFSSYLNKLGKGARKEWELGTLITVGRGGSDLTAITIGRELRLREIQVWKDVDGVFTCDPNVYANAIPLPYLTFDEAAEFGFFAPQPMQLAIEGGIPVIVKNSYNPQAPGTVITKTRDMSKSITGIVLKSNITMLDIERTSMTGQNAFVVKAMSTFQEFEDLGFSVDCLATGQGKMSFALVPSEHLSGELIQLEFDNVVEKLRKFAAVCLVHHRSFISLIGNAQIERALNVIRSINVEVQKVWQGSSKVTKISMVVSDSEAEECVGALHSAFVELNGYPVPVNPSSASAGTKRKERDGVDQPEASYLRQKRTNTDLMTVQANNAVYPKDFLENLLNDDVVLDGVDGDDSEYQACELAAGALEVDDYPPPCGFVRAPPFNGFYCCSPSYGFPRCPPSCGFAEDVTVHYYGTEFSGRRHSLRSWNFCLGSGDWVFMSFFLVFLGLFLYRINNIYT